LTAAKALAFVGILLDVISAFLALLSSTLLQAKISEVQRLLDGITHMSLDDLTKLQEDISHADPTDPFRKFFVDTPLWESLKLEVLTRIMARLEELKKRSADRLVGADPTSILSSAQTPPPRSGSRRHHDSPSDLDRSLAPASSKSTPTSLDADLEKVRYQISHINSRVEGLLVDIRNLVPEVNMIQQACQRIENIGSVGDSAGTAILLGGLAFLSSSVCLAASTQPREVWIPTVVACASVLYLPGTNMLLKYFNIREFLSVFSHDSHQHH
jgi:hypothetical protein